MNCRFVSLACIVFLLVSMSSTTLRAQTFPAPQPDATFPPGGGQISLFMPFEFEAAGLDFQSPSGQLIPVPEEVGPAPFAFFLSNTPIQVTYGNLGTVVSFAAESTTELSVGVQGGATDVFWAFGPTAVPVREQVPEPAGLALLYLVACFLCGTAMQRRTRRTRAR